MNFDARVKTVVDPMIQEVVALFQDRDQGTHGIQCNCGEPKLSRRQIQEIADAVSYNIRNHYGSGGSKDNEEDGDDKNDQPSKLQEIIERIVDKLLEEGEEVTDSIRDEVIDTAGDVIAGTGPAMTQLLTQLTNYIVNSINDHYIKQELGRLNRKLEDLLNNPQSDQGLRDGINEVRDALEVCCSTINEKLNVILNDGVMVDPELMRKMESTQDTIIAGQHALANRITNLIGSRSYP